jgi:uncharacterized membrane protein YwzB
MYNINYIRKNSFSSLKILKLILLKGEYNNMQNINQNNIISSISKLSKLIIILLVIIICYVISKSFISYNEKVSKQKIYEEYIYSRDVASEKFDFDKVKFEISMNDYNSQVIRILDLLESIQRINFDYENRFDSYYEKNLRDLYKNFKSYFNKGHKNEYAFINRFKLIYPSWRSLYSFNKTGTLDYSNFSEVLYSVYEIPESKSKPFFRNFASEMNREYLDYCTSLDEIINKLNSISVSVTWESDRFNKFKK